MDVAISTPPTTIVPAEPHILPEMPKAAPRGLRPVLAAIVLPPITKVLQVQDVSQAVRLDSRAIAAVDHPDVGVAFVLVGLVTVYIVWDEWRDAPFVTIHP